MTFTRRWSDVLLEWTDRIRWYIPALILIVYLIGFTGVWRPEPDAALYLNLGRNLAEGKGYTYHDVPHRLAYPGWPWVLSVIYRATPDHAIFWAHVAILLMGLAGIALMYRLMSLHTIRPVAVLMTAGLAASRTYYRYCFETRSEMQFMLGVMMVLAGYEGIVRRGEISSGESTRESAATPKPWLDWSLFIGGLVLGIVTRPTMWPILAAVAVAIAWDIFRKRLSRKFLIALAVPVLAGVAFLALNPRQPTKPSGIGDYEDFFLQSMTVTKITDNLWRVVDPMASEALFGLDLGEAAKVGPISMNVVGSVAALIAGLAMFRQRALWGIIVVFTVGMMTVSVVQDRYFLPLLPIMIYGWWLGIRWINLNLPRRWGNLAFAFLFGFGSCPNGAKIGAMFIEQRHRNPITVFRKGKFASIEKVAAMVDKHVPAKGAIVFSPTKTERILTYYTRRVVREPGAVKWVSPDKQPVFVLLQADMDPAVPLKERLGPELDRVQGPYDKQPWVLYQVR